MLRLSTLALLLVAAPVLATTTGQFRGPGGIGWAQQLPDADYSLAQAWKVALGSGYSNVTIADDLAVTMFTSGDEDVLAAFDIATGAERWRFSFGPKYAGHDGSDDGPLATPVVVDGTVYTVGPKGLLVAVGLSDGARRWSVQLDESSSTVPFYGYTASPVIAGDLVLLATGGEGHMLSAFDRSSGALRWAVGNDGITYQTPILLELAGRSQLVVTSDFFLYGLDPASGATLWELRHTEGTQNEQSAHAVPVDDQRFLVKYGGGARLYTLGAEGPTETWRTRGFGNTFAIPVYHDGHFYGFTGRFLTCVRASDGEIVWRSRPPGGLGLSLVDGVLAIVDPQGNLVLAEANPTEYREITRLPVLERGDYAVPTLAGGRFYVRNLTELAAIDVREGVAAAPVVAEAAPKVLGAMAAWVAAVEAAPAGARAAKVDERFGPDVATPVVDADGTTHFVWRGDAKDVGLAGDVAPAGEELAMHQVAGTDLWLRSVALDRAAQYSYAFVVDFGQPGPDPRNPHQIDNGFARFSDLRMPEWPAAPHLEPAPAAAKGTLDGFPFRSEKTNSTREIKVWRPAGYGANPEQRYPLLVVNHGDNLLRGGLFQNTLENLVGNGVEPVVAVFVPRAAFPEYGGANMDDYVAFLVDELIPHLERHYRLDPDRRVVLGPASAGVTSLYAALARPGVFDRVGLQSYYDIEPANERITELLAGDGAKPELVHVIWSRHDYDIPNGPSSAEATKSLLERLRSAKVTVVEEVGTHSPNWGGWRGQDDELLRSLLPQAAN